MMQKTNTFSRPHDQTKSPLAQKSTNYVELYRQQTDKPQINHPLNTNGFDRRQTQFDGRHQNRQSPPVGPEETYLAKSIKRDPSGKIGDLTTGATSQLTNIPSHSA